MKIWCISDSHGFHREYKVPEGLDMIIFAGDCSNYKNPALNEDEVSDFLSWYSGDDVPAKYKIFVSGNHDTSVERKLILPSHFPDIIYLEHESTEIEGIKIFGSPYTPEFCNWAFNVSRHKIDSYWTAIPGNTDILVTHGPPKGILDMGTRKDDGEIEYCGDKALLNHVLSINPKYHIFGHIHENGEHMNKGTRTIHGYKTQFMNVSCVTDRKFNLGLTSNGLIINI